MIKLKSIHTNFPESTPFCGVTLTVLLLDPASLWGCLISLRWHISIPSPLPRGVWYQGGGVLPSHSWVHVDSFSHDCWHSSVTWCSVLHSSTWSQNHRMVGIRRDLWRSSSPTSLPKQVHLKQAARDLIQAGVEYLQRRKTAQELWV